MIQFLRNLFKDGSQEGNFQVQEIEQFIDYLKEKRFEEIFTENIEARLKSFSRMSLEDKLRNASGLYLLIEKSYCGRQKDQHKERSNLRREVKARFPNLIQSNYFEVIFLSNHDQEQKLAHFLIEHVWEKIQDIVGQTKEELHHNYDYQVNKAFEQFRYNQLSRLELQSTLKYEVLSIYDQLSAIVGKPKASVWLQDSYAFLTDNYKFLDVFSFLVALIPESLLTEQQLSLLSRAQIESVLIEKTEKLESFNQRLKEEVAEKEKAQLGLRENAERLNRIIENAMDAVVLMDSNGRVTYWNSQAEDVFGWKQEEVLGETLAEYIIPKEKRAAHTRGLQMYLESGRTSNLNRRFEETGLTKAGSRIPLELSIVANRINNDVIFTSFIRDISERKQYEQDLMDARDKAEKASRTKADFLSTMSHEIRTPMNGLFGTIELLLAENPRTDQVESLNLMKHSTESLLVILNDILDFSKLEEGHVEFDNREFLLSELCKRVISTYIQRAEEKGIKLFLKSDSNAPDSLKGDPVRLSQILNNLISNAIKFTFTGEVELRVELIEDAEKEATFRFDVKDTGLGIPDDDLKRIFDRFTQVEDQKVQLRQSGTGLGLAICKKLLNLQNSDLQVESKLGEGSRFYFEITLKKHLKSSKKKTRSAEINKDLSGLKVLIVEDNKVNQIIARKFLEKWNCDIDFANNGREALDVVQTQEHDIILMDLQMPVMNGYDAASKIRQMNGEYFRDVPIVALTADVLPEVREQAKQAGMSDFMTKPFDSEKLFFTITSNLKFFKMSR